MLPATTLANYGNNTFHVQKTGFLALIANLATNKGLTLCLVDVPSCPSPAGSLLSLVFHFLLGTNGDKYSPAHFVHRIYWVFTLRIVSGKLDPTAASHQLLEPIWGSSWPWKSSRWAVSGVSACRPRWATAVALASHSWCSIRALGSVLHATSTAGVWEVPWHGMETIQYQGFREMQCVVSW